MESVQGRLVHQRANALKISVPRRTPPSRKTGTLPLTARTTCNRKVHKYPQTCTLSLLIELAMPKSILGTIHRSKQKIQDFMRCTFPVLKCLKFLQIVMLLRMSCYHITAKNISLINRDIPLPEH